MLNGVTGNLPWNGSDWLGWSGKNLDATIDLSRPVTFTKVSVDVLQDEASWIYLPTSVEVLVSDDGVIFKSLKKISSSEIKPGQRLITLNLGRTTAKFVKSSRKIAEQFQTVKPEKEILPGYFVMKS